MRAVSLLFLNLALALATVFAQTGTPSSEDLFRNLKVDVSIVVTKHNTGADMVEITAESADYPRAELEAQATAIGDLLGVQDRGLVVFASGSGAPNGSSFLKATFATNGILAGDAGIRLQPLTRAFAGSQYPVQVQGLLIGLPDAKVLASTLPRFDSNTVQVQGRTSPGPGIEYRIALKTQDPSKIIIPDKLEPPTTPKIETNPSGGVPIAFVWILTIVGAAAAGALVYNLALRGSSRTPRR